MKIINDNTFGDYHLHSSTLSDGMNSIDEIVIEAGKLKYKEIAITDHNQEYLERYHFKANTHYSIISSGRWKNIHNDVHIIFGVEADLLNENGDICNHIQNIIPEFMVLSTHQKMYSGNDRFIKKGYLNAIRRYGSKINLLGHLCSKQFSNCLNPEDIIEIVLAANKAGIALELNSANLVTIQSVVVMDDDPNSAAGLSVTTNTSLDSGDTSTDSGSSSGGSLAWLLGGVLLVFTRLKRFK